MPLLYDVTDDSQHKKCFKCSGAKTECQKLIQCSYALCGRYCHVDCLPDKFNKSELETLDFWYCKKECQTKHEPDRLILEARKIPQAAEAIKLLEKRLSESDLINEAIKKQRDEAQRAAKVLDQSRLELMEQHKKKESDSNLKMLSSTFAQQSFSTAHGSSIFDASSIHAPSQSVTTTSTGNIIPSSDPMIQILERVKQIESSRTQQANETMNANPFAIPNGTFSSEDLSQAHAIASLTLTLSERRKQLPKLPEFDGKGAEWLHFRNIYRALREEGRYDNREMNAKLSVALKGQALEFTRLWLYSSRPNPDKIVQDLEDRFFSPVAVMTDTLDVVNDIQPIKDKDRNALELFKRAVDGFISICTDVEEVAPLMIRIPETVEDKLPDDLIEKWNKNIRHKIYSGNWYDFSKFLLESTFDLKIRVSDRKKSNAKDSKTPKSTPQVSAAKVHVITTQQPEKKPSYPNSRGNSSKPNSKHQQTDASRPRYIGEAPPCDYDSCSRPLYRCAGFAKRLFDIKNAHIQLKGYCARCLRKGHAAITCPNAALLPKCRVNGCSDPSSHTTVMHPPECTATVSHINDTDESSFFMVALVNVEDSDGNEIPVTVFIDCGSNASLITHDLYKRLRLKGDPYRLMVSWCAAGVKQRSLGSFKTELKISSFDNPSEKILLKNIISMENLQLPLQEQSDEKLHQLFPHLRNIDIPNFPMQRPQILLGLHHRALCIPERVVYPPPGTSSAIAEKTRLGWVISCANLPNFNLNTVSYEISTQTSDDESEEVSTNAQLQQLNELVKYYINADLTSGVDRDQKYLTADEYRAREVLSRTMRKVDNRYEVGMLWKSDDIFLPNNSSTALSRLKSTEATLKKKNLVQWSIDHHKTLQELGFARELTEEELNPVEPHKRINYVIGFVVINQNKIPPKPRWVVDTACKHNGISLNSAILKGEDNLIPLTQALFHFRERAIATCADVEKQFHQVRIIKEDLQCQRFYWRDCDVTKDPKIFVYTAMLFGPTDSPSKANAVRILHAQNSASSHPAASRAALDSMYMDDQFNSEDTIEEAVVTSQQSIDMFGQISWKLVDFRSNAPQVLARLPFNHVNKSVAVELSKDDPTLMCCKVLGLYWNPTKDIFEFRQTSDMELRLRCLNEGYRPTKLQVLSFIMRIFDCLGFIAHFIVRGRMIMQETWKAQLEWNSPLNDDMFDAWILWLKQFDEISRLEIPRHYGYITSQVARIEMHIFTDASAKAFAAVGYYRFSFNNGGIKVVQAMAKARVAPINKPRTIPKLELDGAVIGARLAKVISEQHKRLNAACTVLWTDSEIVLKWIRGTHLQLMPYVAPRVSEIRDAFPISNWRYVPSQQNPADHGTKCTQIDFSDNSHPWFTGPEFLYNPIEEWPQDKGLKPPQNDVVILATNSSLTEPNKYYAGIIDDISPSTRANWTKYKKITAIILRVTGNFSKKIIGQTGNSADTIEPDELEDSEIFILGQLQKALWGDEINVLMRGSVLRKNHSTHLISLNPFLGPRGLLRSKTRFSNDSSIPYAMRCPIILPNSHETVDAIVRSYHEENYHYGVEAVVAKLRSKYWIIAARQAVKRCISRCLICMEFRAKPYNVPTGELPDIRVTPTSKAFEHVGVDCFGPFTIYSGDSKRKREVNAVIFTCMTSRAIYLRRLDKLSTDEMFVAIQELWTRRGPVCTIRSDNGRNFVGCSNILSREFRQGLSTKFGIQWIFNPAYTPQWGGSWERLIKDVKKAMKIAMKEQIVPQRVFDCILYQVEDIINSRPLTHVPSSPHDDFPITPNLMLKMHPGYQFLSDSHSTNNPEWLLKKAKKFSEKIMSRWTKEYTPVIAHHLPKKGPARDIKVGDYVIYCDPACHPQDWPRGLVSEVYVGRDGYARVADIRLKDGTIKYKRSAYRLARLPIDDGQFSNDHLSKASINITIAHFLTTSSNEFLFRSGALDLKIKSEFTSHLQQIDATLENQEEEIFNSHFSFFVNVFQGKIEEMSAYNKISRLSMGEILKGLSREPFVKSSEISENAASATIRNILITSLLPDYQNTGRTLKLTIGGGIICIADLTMSLASVGVEPAWISCTDQYCRAPIVAFIKCRRDEDYEKLSSLKKLEVINGAFIVSKPKNFHQMTVTQKGREHALVKIALKPGTNWKFLVTRLSGPDPQYSHLRTNNVDDYPHGASLIGLIWYKRFRSLFKHKEFMQMNEGVWKDFRVQEPNDRYELNDTNESRESENQVNVQAVTSTVTRSFAEKSTQTDSPDDITVISNATSKLSLDTAVASPSTSQASKSLLSVKTPNFKSKKINPIKKDILKNAFKKTRAEDSASQKQRIMPSPMIIKEEPKSPQADEDNIVEINNEDDFMDLN